MTACKQKVRHKACLSFARRHSDIRTSRVEQRVVDWKNRVRTYINKNKSVSVAFAWQINLQGLALIVLYKLINLRDNFEQMAVVSCTVVVMSPTYAWKVSLMYKIAVIPLRPTASISKLVVLYLENKEALTFNTNIFQSEQRQCENKSFMN